MGDEMFFSQDGKSVYRGRRKAMRTDTCRPCLIWNKEEPENKTHGVVMDVSLYGMRLRTLEEFPMDTTLVVQMMRDDEFRFPLASPREGVIVREYPSNPGFYDYGIRLSQGEIKRVHEQAVPIKQFKARPVQPKPNAQPVERPVGSVIDILLGNRNNQV